MNRVSSLAGVTIAAGLVLQAAPAQGGLVLGAFDCVGDANAFNGGAATGAFNFTLSNVNAVAISFDTHLRIRDVDTATPDDVVDFFYMKEKILPGQVITYGAALAWIAGLNDEPGDPPLDQVCELTITWRFQETNPPPDEFDIFVMEMLPGSHLPWDRELELIPSPGTIGCLALAGLVAARRRRS